jgi:hypothetical protein
MIYPALNGPEPDDAFPLIKFCDDTQGGHRAGSGPFFVCSRQKTRSKAYNQSGTSSTEIVKPGVRYSYPVQSGSPDWLGETYFTKVGTQSLMVTLVCKSWTFGRNDYELYWEVYPIIEVDVNTSTRYFGGRRCYWPPSIPSYARTSREAVLDWAESVILENYGQWSSQGGISWFYKDYYIDSGGSSYADLNEIGLDHGEYQFWLSQTYDTGVIFSGSPQLHAGLFAQAYQDAADRLPALHQNTIQNILEVIDTIRSFLDGFDSSDLRKIGKLNRKALLDTSSDLWLRYRYQYTTTVSDLTEITEAACRFYDVMDNQYDITSYGVSSDETGHYHCALCTTPAALEEAVGLRTLGLLPTSANLWDMVPYSFIVDWFLHISDVLEAIDKWVFDPKLSNCAYWYSFTNSYTNAAGDQLNVFFRFSGGRPLFPVFRIGTSSTKTFAMRIADTIALLL